MQPFLFSWRVFVRFLAMVLLGGMFAYTIINSFVISNDNERIQNQQLSILTNLLISQTALASSDLIINDDQEGLMKSANKIASDNLVYDVTIYNAEGVKLVNSDNALSAREVLGLDTPLKTSAIGRAQLVKPILNDEEKTIGFIRITFEKGKLTAISNHRYRNSDHLMYTMLILSFISGILLCLLMLYKPKDGGENILLKDL